MAKGRDNGAESLGGILEYLRTNQQTGLLSIETPQGEGLEEGELYVQAGRFIYAYTGGISGQNAIDRLLLWRPVRFAFFPNAPYPAPSLPLNGRSSFSSLAFPTSSPELPLANGDTLMAADRVNDDANGYIGISSRANTYKPGLEWLIPQRLGNDVNVLSLALTRRQRSVYLLVDSKRTISDLARCTGKSIQEIERILIELQERGLLSV